MSRPALSLSHPCHCPPSSCASITPYYRYPTDLSCPFGRTPSHVSLFSIISVGMHGVETRVSGKAGSPPPTRIGLARVGEHHIELARDAPPPSRRVVRTLTSSGVGESISPGGGDGCDTLGVGICTIIGSDGMLAGLETVLWRPILTGILVLQRRFAIPRVE